MSRMFVAGVMGGRLRAAETKVLLLVLLLCPLVAGHGADETEVPTRRTDLMPPLLVSAEPDTAVGPAGRQEEHITPRERILQITDCSIYDPGHELACPTKSPTKSPTYPARHDSAEEGLFSIGRLAFHGHGLGFYSRVLL